MEFLKALFGLGILFLLVCFPLLLEGYFNKRMSKNEIENKPIKIRSNKANCVRRYGRQVMFSKKRKRR